MQVLFKNKTILSTQNYTQLLKFHQKKNNGKYFLYTATFALLFVICISYQIVGKNYLIALLLFALFTGFLSYRFIQPYYKTKKEYHSDKVQKNLVNQYCFYDKYFEISNTLGNSKFKYYKLYRVYETSNYFYLYLNKTNALIIEKAGFMIGNSNSFKKFIKTKVGFKFKKN